MLWRGACCVVHGFAGAVAWWNSLNGKNERRAPGSGKEGGREGGLERKKGMKEGVSERGHFTIGKNIPHICLAS